MSVLALIESVYEKCFTRELTLKGIQYKSQQSVPLEYKGLLPDAQLRFDVLVEDILLVELKSIDGLLPIHEAIILTYMECFKSRKK